MVNINCIHFSKSGRCAHPDSRQSFFSLNRPCVYGDARCAQCRIQVEHVRLGPPGKPFIPQPDDRG